MSKKFKKLLESMDGVQVSEQKNMLERFEKMDGN